MKKFLLIVSLLSLLIPSAQAQVAQNYIIKKGVGQLTAQSQVFDNGTNVGVGSTAPAAKLDVAGSIKGTSIQGVQASSINWDASNLIQSTSINWQDIKNSELAQAGVNWDDVKLNNSGINWTDTFNLSQGTASTGNLVFASASDDLSTLISNAAANAVIILPPGNFTLPNSVINVSKSVHLVAQNDGATTILDTASHSSDGFNITAAPFSVEGINFRTTKTDTLFHINATAGTAFTYDQILFKNLNVTMSHSGRDAALFGVYMEDSGATVKNVNFNLTGTPGGNGNFFSPFYSRIYSSCEIDENIYISDTTSTAIMTDINTGNINKGFFFINWTADPSLNTLYVKLKNVTSDSELNGTNTGIAYGTLCEGARTNCTYNGGYFKSTTGSATNYRGADMKFDVNSVGTIGENLKTFQNNISVTNGASLTTNAPLLSSGGIYGDLSALQLMNFNNAAPLIYLKGAIGGDNTNTGSSTAYAGSNIAITLGNGGTSSAATTNGVGGIGGTLVITGGSGGNQTAATATNNTGGKGSDFTITTGTGGNAASASGTNTGGNGGDLTLQTGAGGTGSTTNGNKGSIIFKNGSTEIARFDGPTGNIGIGTSAPTVGIISFKGDATKAIQIDKSSTASSAGKQLTLQAGESGGNADLAGGTLSLRGGNATGTGSSLITFYTAIPGTTGTSVRSTSEKMRIDGNGNVGINSTAPNAKLEITGAGVTTGQNLSIRNSNHIVLLTGLDNGNFGIGPSTPAYKLEVDGGIYGMNYYSSDGSQGATVTTCTGFKNGLCISGT